MSQKTLDTIRGIAQAAADIGYDGSINENGEPVKIGLKREEGHPIYGSRVMDGFNIGISGKTLVLSYHSDVKLKEIYSQDFEVETGRMMSKIISELKKRFKANEGKSLSLKDNDDLVVRVESTSRVRCWATAKRTYGIGNLSDVEDVLTDSGPPKIEKNFEKFLKQGGNKYKS